MRVSYVENQLGENTLHVVAAQGATLGAGDVVVTTFPVPASRWQRFAVYVDPDSAPATGAVTLEAGSDCSAGWPYVTPAPLPDGAIYCSYANSDTREVEFDLRGSTYTGGELSLINTTSMRGTFRGSPYADNFYGGPGNDSMSGAGGDDVIFGGDGDDWMLGGAGADSIDGEGGSDVIFGDEGADTITVDDDGRSDWVNCNNFDVTVQNTDNDPDNPPINRVFADKGLDRITDCGVDNAPVVSTYPVVGGAPRAGMPVTAQPGTWQGKALILSYAWFACPTADSAVPEWDDAPAGDCTEVFARDGVQGLTYRPAPSTVGKFLRLRATALNNAGFAVAVSEASEVVKASSPAPGTVRDLNAKASTGKKNGKKVLSIAVSWTAPWTSAPA